MNTQRLPEEEIRRTERGLFFQTPDVLMMTCNLPDGPQLAFLRIGDKTKFDDYKFYGSVRKFGLLAKIKRDKADRNLKTLKNAGLITAKVEEDGRTLYTLNMDELWELNAAYHEGIPIPPWKNLQEALERVRKIRQKLAEEQKACPKNQTTVSEIPVTSPEKSDNSVRDSGQSVRSSVLEAPPKKGEESRKIPKERREKEGTPSIPSPSPQISPEVQRIWDWFCEQEVAPIDRVKAMKRCAVIAADIKTHEQFAQLHAIAHRKVQGKEDCRPNLGNMESVLPIWRNARDQVAEEWWKQTEIPGDNAVIATSDDDQQGREPTTDEIPVVLPELPRRQHSRGMNAGAAESLARQVAECYPGLMAQFGEIAVGRYLLYIWYGDRDDQWFALDLVAWWNMTPELQRLIDQAVLHAAADQSAPEISEETREMALAL